MGSVHDGGTSICRSISSSLSASAYTHMPDHVSCHTDHSCVTVDFSSLHTHTPTKLGPFSRTTRVSRYQKGKTNLDFTEARDCAWQWHQLGHMQVCISLQTTTPAPDHSFFYRPDALPAAQQIASKH